MPLMKIEDMGVVHLAESIRSGDVSSVDVVGRFLEIIEELEGDIKAWEFIDPEYALYQAGQADKRRAEGLALGPLHGIPVGVKDIFDTFDMPTENGTVLHRGRRPSRDSFAVSLLRGAGAVILGKTVTAELAYYAPGKTANPHNPRHTPGGSSSGSAAAVAAGMVPLAVGTQTNGSIIRPASFCGVIGFKPTHGTISRSGVLHQSWHLDQVGVFANSAEDAAVAADTLMRFDAADRSMRPCARANLYDFIFSDLAPGKIGFVKTPVWNQAEPWMMEAFETLARKLDNCAEVGLPKSFDEAVEMHKTIMEADFAYSFKDLYDRGKESLSPMFCGAVERGREVTAVAYNRAVESITRFNRELEDIFSEYDIILTPATPGAAPEGLDTTGSPIFCTIWTLCGVPAVSLPIMKSESGLPVGVQLIGRKQEDGRLLSAAKQLLAKCTYPFRAVH
jgi:Asp-tRNA(Asn)/Glu-tRNA(Gln) amidotransferase A subunit family amidase